MQRRTVQARREHNLALASKGKQILQPTRVLTECVLPGPGEALDTRPPMTSGRKLPDLRTATGGYYIGYAEPFQ